MLAPGLRRLGGWRPAYRGGMQRKREEPLRITTASRPRSEDIRGRERRYIISMGIRTLCFVLAVVFMGHWVMWVFLVGAVFLPYVAVVMANAGVAADPGGSDFEYRPDLRAISDRPIDQ
jgi:Flp pilus assembly protein TadB